MEYLDIVDKDGNPTGKIVERTVAHRDGVLHRTAHVWITRGEGKDMEVLLQKRSEDKDCFPGLFDTSSAGHIPAGSGIVESALRELEEELGLFAKPEELLLAGTFSIEYTKVFHGKPFHDNEVTFVYFCTTPVDISNLHLQKEEISEVRWFNLDEVYRLQTEEDPRFCIPMQGLDILMHYCGKL